MAAPFTGQSPNSCHMGTAGRQPGQHTQKFNTGSTPGVTLGTRGWAMAGGVALGCGGARTPKLTGTSTPAEWELRGPTICEVGAPSSGCLHFRGAEREVPRGFCGARGGFSGPGRQIQRARWEMVWKGGGSERKQSVATPLLNSGSPVWNPRAQPAIPGRAELRLPAAECRPTPWLPQHAQDKPMGTFS